MTDAAEKSQNTLKSIKQNSGKAVDIQVMLIGGALGLTQIQKLRYFSQSESVTAQQEEEVMNRYQKQFALEILGDERIKKILEEDKDLPQKDWANIKGPPLASDSRKYQEELRKKMEEHEKSKS